MRFPRAISAGQSGNDWKKPVTPMARIFLGGGGEETHDAMMNPRVSIVLMSKKNTGKGGV
jgi:hypothetical protein